ncbi:uncharacterized protein LOC143488636 isoform X2 [Brachyhypopomus gauderio]|uniref:uncharacterized protein LOC143488636 isoform X2 n=1 Tax=Brachyhypopomus gauderio TaxID=698409 RepID=UPI004042DEA8
MMSSLRKSKGTYTRGLWSNMEPTTSTYRDDYQPFQHSLQGFLPNLQRRSKAAPPALIQAPDMDKDKWARLRRYCYRTSNSVYGSSPFGQKGQSVIVLEEDEDLHASSAGSDQGVLPRLGQPTTCTPPPQGWDASPTPFSTPVAPKSPSMQLSSTTLSSALTTPTLPSISLSPAPGLGHSHCHKEEWEEVTGVKETMPVAKETMANATRFPHIGSGKVTYDLGGRGPVLQEGSGQKGGAGELFPKDPCLSTELERVRRTVYNSGLSRHGVPCGNVTAYKRNIKAQEEALKLREAPRLDRKTTHCRSPWVSEYVDQYCSTQRRRPPHAIAPPPGFSRPAVPRPPQTHRVRTEYQANYGNVGGRRKIRLSAGLH